MDLSHSVNAITTTTASDADIHIAGTSEMATMFASNSDEEHFVPDSPLADDRGGEDTRVPSNSPQPMDLNREEHGPNHDLGRGRGRGRGGRGRGGRMQSSKRNSARKGNNEMQQQQTDGELL